MKINKKIIAVLVFAVVLIATLSVFAFSASAKVVNSVEYDWKLQTGKVNAPYTPRESFSVSSYFEIGTDEWSLSGNGSYGYNYELNTYYFQIDKYAGANGSWLIKLDSDGYWKYRDGLDDYGSMDSTWHTMKTEPKDIYLRIYDFYDDEYISQLFTPLTHTLTFTGEGFTTFTEEVEIGDSLYSMPFITRVGYDLVGWRIADGEYVYSPTEYLTPTSCETFEAVWKAKPTILTLTFMGDGVHRFTQELQLGYSMNLPSYTHCENDILLLKGWMNTATGITHEVGSTISPASNTTYKAVWEIVVNFSGDSFLPFAMSAKADGTFIMPNLPNGVSREGYAFGGWTAGGKLYHPFDEVNVLDLGYCDFVAYWIYTGEGIGGGSSGGGSSGDSSGDSGMGSDTEYNFITKFFSDTFNMTKDLCMPYLTSFEIPFLGITLAKVIEFLFFTLIAWFVVIIVSKVIGALK